MRIKTGDTVVVISGKDRGKKGKVTQVFPTEDRVVVDGVNKMVKHLRSTQRGQKGQRIEFHGPIHVSNVMVADPKSGKPTRVRFTEQGEGEDKKKIRVAIGSETELE
ncbi:MAG: 50S ribosomal protein L24 [Candidatus Doudnabacteria bacterium]|nr:50S ribosomal protein L24 [Candidatus Doudnabacteria bacterium]MCA9387430.1 50S ribosomal protein L24 [Candidatus Andersenbacteria bacterium]